MAKKKKTDTLKLTGSLDKLLVAGLSKPKKKKKKISLPRVNK